MFLKEQADGKAPEPRVLDAMFLLNDPKEQAVDTISIKPVPGSQAMIAMIHSTFALDPSDKRVIVNNFQNVGKAISEQLPVFSLQYPRIHERLPDVRASVIECSESC